MSEKTRIPILGRILLLVFALLSVLVAGFVIWSSNPAKPMPKAMEALQSSQSVRVTNDSWLTFRPQNIKTTTGFILYPGGRVDPLAYAPTARAIAEQGFLVVIVRMPLNLAVFKPDAAADVIAANPEILYWAVGGHSLGGSMAANFAHSHPGAVQGLVLWASYPAGSDDLSEGELKVLSISGSLDGLSTPAKITASQALLPAGATFVSILGGDHAQFGWYGAQSGDNPATITRDEQQSQIVQATVDYLSR